MDDVRTGGNGLLGDVDVVGGFTANECGGVVDGIAEGRGGTLSYPMLCARIKTGDDVSTVHRACDGDVGRERRTGKHCAAERREDEEGQTARGCKARWPMRCVGKQHAIFVGGVSGRLEEHSWTNVYAAHWIWLPVKFHLVLTMP